MRVEISLFVGALGVHLARGHGQMYNPTPWQATNDCSSPNPTDCHYGPKVPTDCTGRCHGDVDNGELTIKENSFSTNWTMIPLGMEATLEEDMFDEWLDPGLRVTWDNNNWNGTWTKRLNPWNAPGSAPVRGNGCGVNGGNPDGCTGGGEALGQCCGKPFTGDCGGYSGGKPALEHYRDGLFGEPHVTKWIRGQAAKVYWASNGYHRGGYAYRLCRVYNGEYWKVTEECFQKGHLKFSDQAVRQGRVNKKTSWLYWKPWVSQPKHFEWGWIPMELKTTTIGTTPPGSEWAKVNIPKDLSTADYWAFKDEVDVPTTLAAGDYVLSFRWDCLGSPQIWNACANIQIL